MGLPAPIRIGRLLKWKKSDIGIWLGQVPAATQVTAPRAAGLPRRGRPTKADQITRAAEQEAKSKLPIKNLADRPDLVSLRLRDAGYWD